MFANHNWLFPQSGGRPWLERPPLPQWIEVGTSLLLGQRCDAIWVVRLPSVLMGLAVVLMTAWAAAVWFGRGVGMLSGLVLATMYEFYAYSVLAEDDIFLAAAVAVAFSLFISMEFASGKEPDPRVGFFGNRPWQVWAFFFVLGLMNIVKSPLLGPAAVVGPVGAYLLLSRDPLRIRRYIWLWGWLMFGLLLVSWTLAAMHRYPDVMCNWHYDYEDTTQYDQAFWYYVGVVLPAFCEPWILASITGFIVTRRAAIHRRTSGERFLWCWAILPVIVLSIPHRKHHHYFVPSIALGRSWLPSVFRSSGATDQAARAVDECRPGRRDDRDSRCHRGGQLSNDCAPVLSYGSRRAMDGCGAARNGGRRECGRAAVGRLAPECVHRRGGLFHRPGLRLLLGPKRSARYRDRGHGFPAPSQSCSANQ